MLPARPTALLLRQTLVAAALAVGCGGETGSSAVGAGRTDGGSDGARAGEAVAPVPEGIRCERCPSYAAPVALAAVPPTIDELSGLAASHRHAGVLYAHNDSANTTVFFALDETARILAEVHLAGADSEDFEAVAVGPCAAAASCIYLGDIGDNDRERVEYAVYVAPEPEGFGAGVVEIPFQRFTFVYPDGAHNAETLVVEARSGRIFVITKGEVALVYELPTPLAAAAPATLIPVGTLALPSREPVTDGSFHPCGERLLVRTMDALYELVRPAGGTLEALFASPPLPIPAPVEAKGEAVAYARDGARYFSSGEAVAGQASPALSMVSCAGAP